ncbi:hypothetical protein VTO42DRAFT_8881 [Malbranchea cinnamomea]
MGNWRPFSPLEFDLIDPSCSNYFNFQLPVVQLLSTTSSVPVGSIDDSHSPLFVLWNQPPKREGPQKEPRFHIFQLNNGRTDTLDDHTQVSPLVRNSISLKSDRTNTVSRAERLIAVEYLTTMGSITGPMRSRRSNTDIRKSRLLRRCLTASET